jgi:hypothetical protein
MIRFYGKELLAPRTTPKLEDHTFSAVRDCLFKIFAATLHIGGRSSNHNLTRRQAVVTGTHLWEIMNNRENYRIRWLNTKDFDPPSVR